MWSSRITLRGGRGASGAVTGGASPLQLLQVLCVFRALMERLVGHSSFLQHLQHPAPSIPIPAGGWDGGCGHCAQGKVRGVQGGSRCPRLAGIFLSKLKSPGLWKCRQCLGLAEKPCEVGNAVCAFQWLQLLPVQWGVGSIGCGIIWSEQLI